MASQAFTRCVGGTSRWLIPRPPFSVAREPSRPRSEAKSLLVAWMSFATRAGESSQCHGKRDVVESLI